MYKQLLGNGLELGIDIYEIQSEPNGIAEAFIIGKILSLRITYHYIRR